MSDQGIIQTICDQADMEKIVSKMAHDILVARGNAGDMALIGIQTRGVYLARRIQKQIQAIKGAAPPAGSIDITLYRDDWTRISLHPVVRETRIDFSVDAMRAILVDDVIFTGRTIRAAMNALIDFGRPDRIEAAVMVDRGFRELPIHPDYTGKTIRTKPEETVDVRLSEHDGMDRIDIRREEGAP
ncbi:Pyrimidine operon regulatory protein / Uracil phosphoribosyltransferase [Candidatus Desulfarcum epimagneticum]|uniref:Bifunctional protein PyrR n=1 Tax=uncultured Desulfobacteraceae bacterium TaxID=218296 RepID=A0A484HI64_9BACT|nr:Pyrimidine operon regulatory protein / Uracil phosphoribosyltransferase [uncultured Desulfobacteraceae bacterium]